MQPGFWVNVGEWLGRAYGVYIFGLLLGCVVVHGVVLIAYVAARHRRWKTLLLIELGYGLLNPFVYLVVFQPALFHSVSPWWLVTLEWTLLLGYWGLRSGLMRAPPLPPRIARGWLLGCAALILAVGIRDAAVFAFQTVPWDQAPGALLVAALVSPLYALPVAIAMLDYDARRLTPAEALPSSPPRAFRWALAAALIAVATVAGAGFIPAPAERARRTVLSLRAPIHAAAQRARLDPRLLAAVLFVGQSEESTPVRRALAEVSAGVWQTDAKNDFLLASALDPRLGLVQLRPSTVLVAVQLRVRASGSALAYGKEYRGAPEGLIQRITSPGLAAASPAPELRSPVKATVVRALMDPTRSVDLAAFVLDMLATQWEVSRPGIDVRNRPELLATLYQVGFEGSSPKPDPRPNDFGRRVRAVHDSAWVQEAFGPGR